MWHDVGSALSDTTAALGCVFLVVTVLGWCRTFVHRVPPAHGDAGLAEELGRLAGRRTRRIAAAVIDRDGATSTAFIGADEKTRFEIGSITKALTGMLLAEAVRRGEVSLDSTVDSVLPRTAGSPVGAVTLRELCTHTSGLPGLPHVPGMAVRVACWAVLGADPYRGLTPAVVLEHACRQRLRHRGGSGYSNLGAAVLGQALAAAAGLAFPALLAERVCAPVGMSSTRIAARGGAAPRGWTAGGRRPQAWVLDGYAPAGGAVSTVADLTLLATALLDGSAPGRASLDPLGSFVPDRSERSSGMFWVIDTVPGTGRSVVWHNGQTGGYSAFLALYPEAHRAVVVLGNTARAAEQERIAVGLVRWLIRTSHPRPAPIDDPDAH